MVSLNWSESVRSMIKQGEILAGNPSTKHRQAKIRFPWAFMPHVTRGTYTDGSTRKIEPTSASLASEQYRNDPI